MNLIQECQKCNKCNIRQCLSNWYILEDGTKIHATDDYLEYKEKLSNIVTAIDQALNDREIFECWQRHLKDIILAFSLVYLEEGEEIGYM